ncbi:hypothetical protein [Cryptosporangium japonicum]|uniref:hypothetical protein n=1 Tax=Cryptosporangium japonicum TaxID=80872 RepID=UPI0031D30609
MTSEQCQADAIRSLVLDTLDSTSAMLARLATRVTASASSARLGVLAEEAQRRGVQIRARRIDCVTMCRRCLASEHHRSR